MKIFKLFAIGAGLPIVIFSIGFPLFNYLVNPYRVFSSPQIEKINLVKPHATHRARLSKTYSICRFKPDFVALGSSRAEFLIDPTQKTLSEKYDHPYNLALAGSGIYEIKKHLQNAYYASNGKLQTALIALEFFAFNAYREQTVFNKNIFDYDESRMVLSNKDSCLFSYLKELKPLLFSKAAYKASIDTLKQQNFFERYLDNGSRDPYFNMLANALRNENYSQIQGFRSTERSYITDVWMPKPFCKYCFKTKINGSSSLDDFKELVQFARDKNIELKLYFVPIHARLQVSMYKAGLWDLFEYWKYQVVKIAENFQSPHLIEVWDFSGFNTVTNEKVSTVPLSNMKWWFESTHPTSETGKLIVNRIFGSSDNIPNDFGVKLSKDNILPHIKSIREDFKFYRKTNVNDVLDVENAISQVALPINDLKLCKMNMQLNSFKIE